jgi:hypothetical protein
MSQSLKPATQRFVDYFVVVGVDGPLITDGPSVEGEEEISSFR